MTTVQPAVEASGLVKTFGANRAVDGLDLYVPAGQVYGILGPNGAGKTTAIRMLTSLLRPSSGTATVFGHDIVREAAEVRRLVSMTGQFASVDEDLTGYENLVFLSRLWGFTRADAAGRARELLAAFDLVQAGQRLVKTYSGGMRRRLDIAASIVATPQLLFLDEPTTGLDPRSRNHVWDIVRTVVGVGTTVLLTTQYLEEADQLADRIAVIDHGRTIAEGTSSELKASVGEGTLQLRLAQAPDRHAAEQILGNLLKVPVSRDPDHAVLTAPVASTDQLASALAELSYADIPVASVSLGQPSLDEVFLSLTGQPTSSDEHRTTTEAKELHP